MSRSRFPPGWEDRTARAGVNFRHAEGADLGGRFDGHILGERRSRAGRGIAPVSSGPSRGWAILANVENQLAQALGQEPIPLPDVRTDQNVELVATLLADLRAGRETACPGSLVLLPGAVEDSLRWLDAWPRPGPEAALTWLGLSRKAEWAAVVTAAYAQLADHWAAGIGYHH